MQRSGDPVKRKAYQQAWYQKKKAEASARATAWNQANRGRAQQTALRSYLKQQYGISAEVYLDLIEKQNGQCAICGLDEWANTHGRLFVDHDHGTSAVRGLLCLKCNAALGNFGDNEALLRAAIKYLRGTM